MSKGIILVSCGHPFYGKMAAGLAATLKKINKVIPITIACAGSAMDHLNEKELGLFDTIIRLPDSVFIKSWLRVKLLITELSPYDETLFLDVDMAWLSKDPQEIFDQCAPYDFVIKNYDNVPLSTAHDDSKEWAKASDIRAVYGIREATLYSISSEAIYFKKSEAVISLFKDALDIFDNPKIPFLDFAGYMADELAISIACMKAGKYTAINSWNPVFWRKYEKVNPYLDVIKQKFYALSMGGARVGKQDKQCYKTQVEAAYQALGIHSPFTWVDKATFLPLQRKKW